MHLFRDLGEGIRQTLLADLTFDDLAAAPSSVAQADSQRRTLSILSAHNTYRGLESGALLFCRRLVPLVALAEVGRLARMLSLVSGCGLDDVDLIVRELAIVIAPDVALSLPVSSSSSFVSSGNRGSSS